MRSTKLKTIAWFSVRQTTTPIVHQAALGMRSAGVAAVVTTNAGSSGKASAVTTAARPMVTAITSNRTLAPSAATSCGTPPRNATANTPSATLTTANSRCGLALRPMLPWVKVRAQPVPRPATACSAINTPRLCAWTGCRLARANATDASAKPMAVAARRGRRFKRGAHNPLASTTPSRNTVTVMPACGGLKP